MGMPFPRPCAPRGEAKARCDVDAKLRLST
jgi:hypothetical protein